MQQVQDHLEFNIETPSDEELKRRFERHERMRDQADKNVLDRLSGARVQPIQNNTFRPTKTRNRKTNHEKKLERLNR